MIKQFEEFVNEGDNVQNGILLIYGKTRNERGERKIYAVHLLAVSWNKTFGMAHINTSRDMYRIIEEFGKLRASKILVKNSITSVGLDSDDKTPLHRVSVKYDNISTFIRENESLIRQIKGADLR